MVPIISVVGRTNSGKTTFLEKLIPELKRRGYRVAVVKHDAHGEAEVDRPGKDSWRLAQAGSDIVVLASPKVMSLFRPLQQEASLKELGARIGYEADIIITEGYKTGTAPKIEVVRRAVGTELLCRPDELIAVVTDNRLALEIPQFAFDDTARVVDLLEEKYLKTPREEEVLVVVDGQVPSLNPFLQRLFAGIIRVLISSLHGINPDGRVVIALPSREPED